MSAFCTVAFKKNAEHHENRHKTWLKKDNLKASEEANKSHENRGAGLPRSLPIKKMGGGGAKKKNTYRIQTFFL